MIFIIYPILRRYFDFFSKVIAPLLFLIIWGCILQYRGTLLGNWAEWDGIVFWGAIKGCAEMLLGICSFHIANFLNKQEHYSLSVSCVFTFVELFGYFLLLYHMCLTKDNLYSFVLIPIVSISVGLSFSKVTQTNNIFRGRWINSLSVYTLPLYLNQMWCRYLISNYAEQIKPGISNRGKLISYCTLSIIVAVITTTCFSLLKTSKKRH